MRLRTYVSEHGKDWYTCVDPLIYAYGMGAHTGTGTSTFNVILRRGSPSAVLFDRLNGHITICRELQHNKKIHLDSGNNLNWWRLQYRANVYGSTMIQMWLQQEPKTGTDIQNSRIRIQYLVTVSAILSDVANEIAKHWYEKFLRQTSIPSKVLKFHLHAVSLEEEGFPDTVFNDFLTLSPTWTKLTKKPYKMTLTMQRLHAFWQQRNTVGDEKSMNDDATVLDEHVVSRTMRHVYTPQGRKCVVWLHIYGPADDNFKPLYHIANIFIIRYWYRLTRRRYRTRCH